MAAASRLGAGQNQRSGAIIFLDCRSRLVRTPQMAAGDREGPKSWMGKHKKKRLRRHNKSERNSGGVECGIYFLSPTAIDSAQNGDLTTVLFPIKVCDSRVSARVSTDTQF